jgi:UDP-glucuronate 4-epimerase
MAFARIATALVKGEPFTVYGTGEQSRDFTYVGDAVSATIAAMERASAGRVYNVGGGSEASLRAVIAIFERLSGRTLDVRYTEAAAGDVRRTAADTTRIRSEVGWEPKTSLEAGLAAQLADAFDRAGGDTAGASFLEVSSQTGNNPKTGQSESPAK